jgi:hypothetical protein
MHAQIFQLFRHILIFISPCFILPIFYFVMDPFHIFSSIKDYSRPQHRVTINAGHIATRIYDKYHDDFNYDSFIFGNSRSIFWEIDHWKNYIQPNSKCFHFNQSSETLFGINKKILFIDRKGGVIKNALIILDVDSILDSSRSGYMSLTSPILLSSLGHFVKFHLSHFKAFVSPRFLFNFIIYKSTGNYYNFMSKTFNISPLVYEFSSNESRYEQFERIIKKDYTLFYNKKLMTRFYERNEKEITSDNIIFKNERKLFVEIKNIFNKHQTNYKIIINPLYNQFRINDKDLKILNSIFGKENVFNFSGKNKFTNDFKNYYEDSHYRPHVSKEIMKMIYTEKRLNDN